MRAGDRVRHVERLYLGVGTIRTVVKPDVVEVSWEARTETGRRIWGHYRAANLRPARPEEAPGPT